MPVLFILYAIKNLGKDLPWRRSANRTWFYAIRQSRSSRRGTSSASPKIHSLSACTAALKPRYVVIHSMENQKNKNNSSIPIIKNKCNIFICIIKRSLRLRLFILALHSHYTNGLLFSLYSDISAWWWNMWKEGTVPHLFIRADLCPLILPGESLIPCVILFSTIRFSQ